MRGDGERPRGVLPLPGSLASPTLADNWLIPKRQNVLVRDICMVTLLIFSRGDCPSYPFLLDGRMQSEALVSRHRQSPPAPLMRFLAHPGVQVQAEKAEVQSSFILVCERARVPSPEKTFYNCLIF